MKAQLAHMEAQLAAATAGAAPVVHPAGVAQPAQAQVPPAVPATPAQAANPTGQAVVVPTAGGQAPEHGSPIPVSEGQLVYV